MSLSFRDEDGLPASFARLSRVIFSTPLRIFRGNVRARKKKKAKFNSTRRLQRRFHRDGFHRQAADRQTDGWRERNRCRRYAGEVSPSTAVDWRAFATSPTLAPLAPPLRPFVPPPYYAHSRGHPPSHANSHFIGNRDRAHQTITNFPKIRFNLPRSAFAFFNQDTPNYLKSALNEFVLDEKVKFIKCINV